MIKLLIGIDQSYSNTAIVFMKNPHDYSIYRFSAKGQSRLHKLKYLDASISDKISQYCSVDSGCKAFIEGGSYRSMGHLFSLGQLSGIILKILFDYNVECEEVPPTTLKKFITGNGHSNKKVIMRVIERKYNIAFEDDNSADAYVLALMAFYEAKFGSVEIGFRSELEWLINRKKPTNKKKKVSYRRKKLEF